MPQKLKKLNQTKVDLLVDAVIFVAFLITTAPRFSGIAIHEWLSLAFAAAIIVHLLLHWSWLVGVTKRFFGKVQASARINYLLNALLFIDVTLIIFTGVMISQVVLPVFGLPTERGGAWRILHSLTSDLGVLLTGAHLALHWSWIVKTIKRYLIDPIFNRRLAKARSEVQA
ncbi:MAG: DUF4405 domain-containing protein [Thermoflexales bacterium]|nr:DUF4405 domain-containing protein [Thermoflexales bacterium]